MPAPHSAHVRFRSAPPEVRRWSLAIVAIFFACGLALASYLSRLPHVRDALGATTSQMSFVVLALATGSMVGMIAATHVDAWLGPRRAMLSFIVVQQVGLLIAAIAVPSGSYVGVVVGLGLFGAGTGIVDVVMNVSAAGAERALGRTVMPIFHALFSFGTLAGAGLGALAEHAALAMPIHLGAIAAINLVAVGATNRWIGAAVKHDDTPQGLRGRMSAWKDPRTLLIGLVVLGMALAEGSANDWLALTMVDGHGVSNSSGAFALGLFLAAMTAMRLLGVRLVDRFGRAPVVRSCAVIAFVGLALVIFADSTPLAYVGSAVWGAGAALGFPLGMSAAAEDPVRAASRVSVVSTIGYVAFLVGPLAIGFVADHSSLRSALIVVLVAVAIAGLLASAVRESPTVAGSGASS